MPAPNSSGWVNPAAWPGANPAQPSQDSQAGNLDPRMMRQFQVMRRRSLTLAGNGINVPVATSATTLAITFAQPESDLQYGVSVTPGWPTTLSVTAKGVNGFLISFGTAAPASATLDYTTFRTES